MNTMEIVQALRDRGFRLGGSRRMAEKYPDQIRVGPETDWDFYGEDSEASRAFLDGLDFLKIEAENRDYWDDLLVDMYKHAELPIEVLIRREVEVYTAAFESVSPSDFVNSLWKSSPVAVGARTGFKTGLT